MQFGDYASGGLRVRFGENASAGAIAEIVTPSGARARILRRGVTIYGLGGYVNDLDGDHRRESAMELSVGGENLVSIVFSRELSRLRRPVSYRDLHPLEIRWTREARPVNGLRRVADCDGDRRPELVVQTSEDRCPGGCSETGPRTRRLRAYVVSGRDARAGRVRVGGRRAPLAHTVDED
ncbi:hypothetical protein [Patulibacter minatonensis]|uniref:hypothetical protein n=1 Tax=Patulibacter minatonensis TaxID=298163 RepID=UPI00047B49A0|nr:hypothetical protein [Patulibacter minatonensis]